MAEKPKLVVQQMFIIINGSIAAAGHYSISGYRVQGYEDLYDGDWKAYEVLQRMIRDIELDEEFRQWCKVNEIQVTPLSKKVIVEFPQNFKSFCQDMNNIIFVNHELCVDLYIQVVTG